MENNKSEFIAIDWGSSSFRAFLISVDNQNLQIRDQISSEDGIFSCNNDFEAKFLSLCQTWINQGPLPIILSGMVGSPSGFKEVPYAQNSKGLGLDSLLSACEETQFAQCPSIILPGVAGTDDFGFADVMRGEEIQVFGGLHLIDHTIDRFCLPGTHSKWVKIENNRLTNFSTYMTGEMFSLFKNQSSLTPILESESSELDHSSFLKGFEYSQHHGHLLHQLFYLRAAKMTNHLPNMDFHSFLSGLIIGHELLDATSSLSNTTQPIAFIGSKGILTGYQWAMEALQIEGIFIDSNEAFLAGVHQLVLHFPKLMAQNENSNIHRSVSDSTEPAFKQQTQGAKSYG